MNTTDTNKARIDGHGVGEWLQEQLVHRGDVSSMRYIGDDFTRIITIREDRLLEIIDTYAEKRIAELSKEDV